MTKPGEDLTPCLLSTFGEGVHKRLRAAVRRWFRSQRWFLVVNTGPRLADSRFRGNDERESGNNGMEAAAQVKIHRAPRGRFWADPFPIVVDSKVWVFFEDYSFQSKRAAIACAPVSPDGELGAVAPALECPYHLSYPFVFEHHGQLYLIPDTWDEHRVDLWRCRRFPDNWTRERTLLDGVSMSDPTLHRQDGKLWLFGTVSEVRARANDELHIYMADTLEGAWRPHPANPVVSDRGRARPAGRLFFRDGHLIRPAQDCYGRYGRAVVLNRIDELNERSYAETPVGRIDGSWLAANAGVHTLNHIGGLEFLDGWMSRFRYPFPSAGNLPPDLS